MKRRITIAICMVVTLLLCTLCLFACGDDEDENKCAAGHTYGEWVETTSATCTTDGERTRTCSVCSHEDTETLPALGHDYSTAFTIDKQETCTEDGSKSKHCSRCESKAEVTVINKLGHDTVNHSAKSATCTEVGWDAYDTCSRCDYTTKTEIPALGHAYDDEDICTVCTARLVGTQSLTYSANEGGASYTVTGIGAITDTDVVIPYWHENCPVTAIADNAFKDCASITSVRIPNSVTSIGNSAFYGCSSLTGVYITDIVAWYNITFGSYYANPLSYAHNLYVNNALVTELVVPGSVTSIGDYAFSGCSSLTSITIPNSVTSIGAYAFLDCSSLTSITIPSSVTSIERGAFSGCIFLTSITIPNSVTSIGDYAFSVCSALTSITIPDSVTSIGREAFSVCSALTSITIPDSVTSIGREAFEYCSRLTSITIPGSVTSIGDYAFRNCSSLTTVYWNATACVTAGSYYDPIFENCTNLTEVMIGDTVTKIPNYAFSGCSSLTSIVIPSSVTSIGSDAFYGCSSLQYNEYDNGLYLGNNENPYVILVKAKNTSITSCIINSNTKIIYASAFSDCSSLGEITIPQGVTWIGYEAFYGCRSLSSITIPSSVTSIGSSAFLGCSSLTSITMPNSVTSIGSYAFYGCNSLTIYCEAESQPSGWDSSWNPSNRPVVWGYAGE